VARRRNVIKASGHGRMKNASRTAQLSEGGRMEPQCGDTYSKTEVKGTIGADGVFLGHEGLVRDERRTRTRSIAVHVTGHCTERA